MTDTDFPPEGGEEQQGADTPPSPPPPRRTRRPRRLLVATALSVAAAATLAVVGAGHLLQRQASGPASLARSSRPSLVAVQVPGDQGPLSPAAIAAKVDPGLVDVNAVFGYAGARGAATGMVLTPSGVVLTNNHVIQGASKITVTDIGNGKTYGATVVGYDRGNDVAVLQLQGASGLQTVPLGDSAGVAVGDRVTALGNVHGRGGTPHVTSGSIVALDRTIMAADPGGANAERLQGVMKTNALIQPGDSGGPLVNDSGQVIGMDAASSAGFGVRPSAVRGFAIPIDTALAISRQIEAGVSSSTVHAGPTAFLGVQIVPSGPASTENPAGSQPTTVAGATVAGVLHGYPAQQAGLAAGDVITSVDGHAVPSGDGLTTMLSTHRPGDTVQLRWIDPSGQARSAAVTLASGPPA